MFLLAQEVSAIAGAAFVVVLTVPTTQDGTPPALESAQGNADLPAVGAGLDVVETSGFEHNVNVDSALAFCLLLGGGHHLLLTSAPCCAEDCS